MATFTLDVSTLSGENLNYAENILYERGRSIQLEWTQSGANQDMRLHGFAVRSVAAEGASVEPS
jgi:hypothetical protein